MDPEEQKKLIDRIEKIEALLFDLANRVNQADDPPQQTQTPQPGPYSPPGYAIVTPQPLSPPLDSDDDDKSEYSYKPDPNKEVYQGEFWLNKIGITLLLLGLGFLFKYSADQNWITPLVRVSFGLILGVGLVGLGMRLPESKRVLCQVLTGGGIAAFYITGYAAFQLYHLVPQYLAFSFMVGITLLSYFLALYQSEPPLAVVAVIGGLGTPFLLHTGSGNIPGLMIYTCVLLAGSMAVYYFRPWRLLFWSTWLGGWIVIGIAVSQAPFFKIRSSISFLERTGGSPVRLGSILGCSYDPKKRPMETLSCGRMVLTQNHLRKPGSGVQQPSHHISDGFLCSLFNPYIEADLESIQYSMG